MGKEEKLYFVLSSRTNGFHNFCGVGWWSTWERDDAIYKTVSTTLMGEVGQTPIKNTKFSKHKMIIVILKSSPQCLKGSRVNDEQRGRGIGVDGTSLGLYKSYEN